MQYTPEITNQIREQVAGVSADACQAMRAAYADLAEAASLFDRAQELREGVKQIARIDEMSESAIVYADGSIQLTWMDTPDQAYEGLGDVVSRYGAETSEAQAAARVAAALDDLPYAVAYRVVRLSSTSWSESGRGEILDACTEDTDDLTRALVEVDARNRLLGEGHDRWRVVRVVFDATWGEMVIWGADPELDAEIARADVDAERVYDRLVELGVSEAEASRMME
jgi:hypothetical protein